MVHYEQRSNSYSHHMNKDGSNDFAVFDLKFCSLNHDLTKNKAIFKAIHFHSISPLLMESMNSVFAL